VVTLVLPACGSRKAFTIVVYGRAVKGKRRGISVAEQEKYEGRLEMISDAESSDAERARWAANGAARENRDAEQ
jgi:hypothetical protein